MKNNQLNDIIKCDVSISNPVSSDDARNTILVVVPGPDASGEKTIEGVTAISTAEELLDYGFTEEDAAYMAATVAFSQKPSPDKLLICVRANNEGTYEDIVTLLDKANAEAEFYGIHLSEFKDSADVATVSNWAEKNEKLFGFEYDDVENCPLKASANLRTFGICSGNADGYSADEQPEVNMYAAIGLMAKMFGYEAGSETWNLKEIALIVPSKLSAEQKKSLEEDNVNAFLRYAGSNVTVGGKTLGGEWIDVIRFIDWIKDEMQKTIFNVMKANTKIPFTDKGIGLIEGAMEKVLKTGQDVGGIVETTYDADGNENPGFKVFVPKSYNLTEEQRKSRVLPGCRWTARLAGAIHVVEIEGYVTF